MAATVTEAPATASALSRVRAELEAFKRKFYLNLLVRGGLVAAGLLLSLFVVFNLLEYFLYLPTWVRGGLLFGFIGLSVYAFGRWIWTPLAALTNLRRLLSDEQAARQVGALFPEVQDRLLNALQLQGQARDNALIAASLEQRAAQLSGFSFAEGINIQRESKPLWKYAAVPLLVVLGIAAVYPALLVQGTGRILRYRQAFAPPAPFQFELKNKQLTAFRGEDFTLNVAVSGQALPASVKIRFAGTEQPLRKAGGRADQFQYTFEQPQSTVKFQLEGAGFASPEYELTVRERPNLRDFKVSVSYPAYTGRAGETIPNGGNLTVPEGSTVRWEFATAATEELALVFQNPNETLPARADDGQFVAERRVLRSQPYQLRLRNEHSLNKDPIAYQLTAVPDLAPSLTLETFPDTTSLRYLGLGGTVRDDYGLTRLQLHYALRREGQSPNVRPSQQGVRPLALPRESAGTYNYTWDLQKLGMRPGDRLEYYVEAWDNDGVRGPKSTRTRPAEFRLPSARELSQQLKAEASSVASQMSQAAKQSKNLERELAKASDKLKTKRDLSFQDRKQLQEMLDQKQQLDQQMQNMQKLFDQLNQKQDQLSPRSEELAKKAEELKKLMADLLDPETKKLYDKLQKLLNEQKLPDAEMQKLLQQLENKEDTLQKELDRALEMFKQMQLEQKLEETTDKLEKLAAEQEKLAEQTAKNDRENPDNKLGKDEQKAAQEQLKQEQANQKQDFEDLKKDLQDLKQMDQELGDQNEIDEQKPDQQGVDQDMQESQQGLAKNQNQKAAAKQKAAAEKLKKMAQKMQEQQSQDEDEQAQQNIDDLRDILENLLTLSFDQEKLMKDFRAVDQTDPRFVQLGQQQRKLRDDAAIIQDSLYALAKKEPKIQSFVTREVGEMNGRMDEALGHIRQRDVSRATATEQQAMTSMNNLALMLADALSQMQQEQQAAQSQPKSGSGKPGKGKKKGKGQGSGPGPGKLGQMQKQLNEQIQQLSKSGKSGKAMSQELAKLAGQQQMLRQAMQQMDRLQQGAGQPGGKPGQQGQPNGKEGKDGKPGGADEDGKGEQGGGGTGDVKKLMEQTETDLVNKRLTQETIMRQQQILTRLLEVEKSARERDQDTKREAQSAQAKPPVFPPAFDKYKDSKSRQTELLQRNSPVLTPYYQREVGEYFQKMK